MSNINPSEIGWNKDLLKQSEEAASHHKSQSSEKKKKKKRESSSSSSSSTSSASSSSDDGRKKKKKEKQERKEKRREEKRLRKQRKALEKAQKKEFKSAMKEKRKEEKRLKKLAASTASSLTSETPKKQEDNGPDFSIPLGKNHSLTITFVTAYALSCVFYPDLMYTKSHVPESKEEYEKRQSQIRRVVDPETGRTRLIKGDGEILEEIVSKDRHREINKQATKADGEFFQTKTVGWDL